MVLLGSDLGDREHGLESEVSAGSTDVHAVLAVRQGPVGVFGVPHLERASRDLDADGGLAARVDVDDREAGEPAHGAIVAVGRQVRLHDLARGALADVGDGRGHDRERGVGCAVLDLEVAVRPLGVAEAEAELTRRRATEAVPAAVADMHALVVVDVAVDGDAVRHRDIRFVRRQGPRQATRRLDRAGEHGGERGAGLLAGQPPPERGGHLVEPGQDHGRAGVDDDDRAWVRGGHAAHELVLAAGQGEGRAVPALGLGLGVGADDDDRDVGCRGRGHSLVELLVDREPGGAVAEVQAHEAAVRLAVDDLQVGLDPHGARGVDVDRRLGVRRVGVARIEDDLGADDAVGCSSARRRRRRGGGRRPAPRSMTCRPALRARRRR